MGNLCHPKSFTDCQKESIIVRVSPLWPLTSRRISPTFTSKLSSGTSRELHQGKSRWHSYHVLVSYKPCINLPFGDCTMYFDHGVIAKPFLHTILSHLSGISGPWFHHIPSPSVNIFNGTMTLAYWPPAPESQGLPHSIPEPIQVELRAQRFLHPPCLLEGPIFGPWSDPQRPCTFSYHRPSLIEIIQRDQPYCW